MAVRIAVLGGNKSGKRVVINQKQKQLEALLQRQIVPALAASVAHPNLPFTYPWCFVIPPETPKHKHYQAGAFCVVRDTPDDAAILGLSTRTPFKWLENNLQSAFHIAFWQSRILASLNNRNESAGYSAELKEWVSSLQRYYSPFWESFALAKSHRFISKADDLLAGCNDVDSNIRSDNGVDIMPWKGWPGCIQTGNNAWLWRQSRHGKIIDSMKISLLGDEANNVC